MEAQLQSAYDTLEQRVLTQTEELKVIQAQLVNAAKLASIGTMVTGIRHELNSPLQIISLTLEELQEDIEEDDFTKSKLLADTKRINTNVSRLAEIITEHHGTLKAESTIGKGATFTITLPLKH